MPLHPRAHQAIDVLVDASSVDERGMATTDEADKLAATLLLSLPDAEVIPTLRALRMVGIFAAAAQAELTPFEREMRHPFGFRG